MKKYIFLGLIIALACFVAPVSADDTTSLHPQILGTVNMSEYPIYEPWNDENIGGWWNSTTNTFDPIAFLKSSVSPYTDFLGAYFYLILYSCFCLLVRVLCTVSIPARLAPPLKNPLACDSLSIANPSVFLACDNVLIPVIPS